MNENLLPIGSIVKVKGTDQPLMITGLYQIQKVDKTQKLFDYLGCLWPEGIVDTDENIFFDGINIDKVLFKGYTDEEEKQYQEKLGQIAIKFKNKNKSEVLNDEPEIL